VVCRRLSGKRLHTTKTLSQNNKPVTYGYDLNQLRTEPWIPNQDERRVIKMSWSVVSAERSSKQRHDTFCDPLSHF